jgi:hypothetical protein
VRAPAVLLLTAALAGCGGGQPGDERRAADDAPEDFRPVSEPDPEPVVDGRWLVARVTRRTMLRTAPDGRMIAKIRRRTEFRSPRVLGVISRRAGWLEVLAPELPNRRTGWIPERSARVYGTDMWVEVDRSRRRARLMRDDEVLRSFPVAVGRHGNETPLGRYAVTDRLHTEEPYSVYGCCAVALTGHQTKLVEGWVGGDRLAIHGTPSTWSVGRAASLGCMRAHKPDIRALMRRLPLGAPVFVRR